MLKTIMCAMAFTMLSLFSFAQESTFGLTAGYLNAEFKVREETVSFSDDGSGFYVGVLADFELNESWHLVPGVNYGRVEETNLLFIPVMAQYHIANSGVFLQVGPQATLNLEDDPGEYTNTIGVDAGFGVGYEINENFFVEAIYEDHMPCKDLYYFLLYVESQHHQQEMLALQMFLPENLILSILLQ